MFASLTVSELEKVLDRTNRKYGGNLVLNVTRVKPNGTRFTLKVKNKRGPGARLSLSEGKPTRFACFHAYGDFIDNLFEMYPKAKIEIRGDRYKANNWVWRDWEVDSYRGISMSELCECS